jgi:hypothetical protein
MPVDAGISASTYTGCAWFVEVAAGYAIASPEIPGWLRT